MQIKYLLTESDMTAFNLHTFSTSKEVHRRKRNNQKFYGIYLAITLLFAVVAPTVPTRLVALGMAGCSAYYLVASSPYFIRRRANRYLKRHFADEDYSRQFCEHTLEIAADGLIERTPYKEAKVGWASIQRIESDDAHTYVYVGPNAAFILPHRDLLEGDLRTFLSALRTHYDPNKTLVHSLSAENLLGS